MDTSKVLTITTGISLTVDQAVSNLDKLIDLCIEKGVFKTSREVLDHKGSLTLLEKIIKDGIEKMSENSREELE